MQGTQSTIKDLNVKKDLVSQIPIFMLAKKWEEEEEEKKKNTSPREFFNKIWLFLIQALKNTYIFLP